MNDTITAIEKENLSAEERKVAFATIIGTTVEWYDFFIYAAAAGLIFKDLFFTPAGSSLGTILTFATVGLSFLFRPLGAFFSRLFGGSLWPSFCACDDVSSDGTSNHKYWFAANL